MNDHTDIYTLAEEHLNGYLFDLAKRRDRAEQQVSEALEAVERAREKVDLIDSKVESTEALLKLVADTVVDDDGSELDDPVEFEPRRAQEPTYHNYQIHLGI